MTQTFSTPTPNGAARLANMAFNPEFIQGAHSAITTCLRLLPEETITIITDEFTKEIAAALYSEVVKVGSKCHVFVIEDYLPRPTHIMPQEALDALEISQVSIFCAQAQTGELSARRQMSDVVNRKRIRHGHMVNINSQIMVEGMRADFLAIDRLSQQLIDKAKVAKVITVKSAAGTDITATFSLDLNWLKTSGIISPDKWGNLPGGEIFTSPYNVNGTFVTDGVVGDYLCEKYGVLENTPLYIDIVDSRITGLRCENKTLLDEFNAYTHTDENSDRVGEFAIGTNLAVKKPIGHILQDEKLPTIHMAFGHPYSEHTGAKWVSTTHIDCVGLQCDIWFDGEPIMHAGQFIFPHTL
jgi:leucyl aminopeptidase (aminopeptidase T)